MVSSSLLWSPQDRSSHSVYRKCTSQGWARFPSEMFLAVLFKSPSEEDSGSLVRWVALWPWVREQRVANKLLAEYKVPEPQNIKWASHKLHLWIYHKVMRCFPSDASKRGLGHITLLLSLPLTFMGGPTEIPPNLTRQWRKCGGFIFVPIVIVFPFCFELLGNLYKNTLQYHLFSWAELISSSAEMLHECYTLTVVIE